MFHKKAFWIISIIVLLLLAGGGYTYYRTVYLPGQEPAGPTIATAQVSRGDLVVSVSGSGTLVPASEIDLGFQSEGYLDQVLVGVGDHVQEGDVLARMETGELEMDMAEAEINARLAQLDLDDAREMPTDAELADARAAVQSAQSALLVAQYTYSTTLNSDFDAAVRARLIEYQWYVDQSWEADEKREDGTISQGDYEEAWANRAAAEGRLGEVSQEAKMEELDSWNDVDQARNNVYQAWENLQILQSGPATDTIMRAELDTDQATLALEAARSDLEAAELRAPIAGTVVEVTAMAGEYVDTSPFITLDDLEEPVLQFWVEESEMRGVVAGNRVEIIFEALPDDTFTGEVVRVDPALVTVDGTLAVQAWASVDTASHPATLLGGMNADVEIISAEARDALLVPIQALRELGTDQYAVFVVQPDGELVLRPVQVGLQDYVNAEILSGLELGEIVSTGVEEETGTSVPSEQEMMPPGPGGGMIRMFGD
jgi:HlyD family secretion protein